MADLDGEFSRFVLNLGVDEAVRAVAGGSPRVRLDRIFSALRARAQPTLLLFDTFEQGGEWARWVEEHALPITPKSAWLRLLVAGQHVPLSAGTAWENRTGPVIELQPLGWGDLTGALESYRASLAIAQRLTAQDPANPRWQRDLSISQDNVARVLRDQGDLTGALESYRAGLAIAQRLAAQDPANAGWQRDLSVSQNKVANVLRAQGDLTGALESYRASFAIAQRLAAQDPANAGWQRDLSISQDNVARVLRDQGDLTQGL